MLKEVGGQRTCFPDAINHPPLDHECKVVEHSERDLPSRDRPSFVTSSALQGKICSNDLPALFHAEVEEMICDSLGLQRFS